MNTVLVISGCSSQKGKGVKRMEIGKGQEGEHGPSVINKEKSRSLILKRKSKRHRPVFFRKESSNLNWDDVVFIPLGFDISVDIPKQEKLTATCAKAEVSSYGATKAEIPILRVLSILLGPFSSFNSRYRRVEVEVLRPKCQAIEVELLAEVLRPRVQSIILKPFGLVMSRCHCAETKKHIDGFKMFLINQAKVIFLNPRPQLKSLKTNSSATCVVCERNLQKPNRYCSSKTRRGTRVFILHLYHFQFQNSIGEDVLEASLGEKRKKELKLKLTVEPNRG
ncbi:hypothetical protein NE237_013497 [Protea cynaroides]|uniref:Uncharacterized protein n=1 Tax=Protea cynaroides TaxID=273540 RepID=A0A9Q0H030_9MAGN|nr:hypothetical protein NE237_013497 [Protea cynaroides]